MQEKTEISENKGPLKKVFNLFKDLTDDERDLISKHSICRMYKKGEIVYKEGETPKALICLIEGKVKVYKEGLAGRDWIARLVKPVEMVGYRALFAEQNYKGTAETIEDSNICIIKKEALFAVLKTNHKVVSFFMKSLATELGSINTRTITLTQKHIRGRLAETLLLLKDTYGFEKDKATLKVYLSREDLANLSNMTSSNAIRTLSAFNVEGIIALDGRKIKLLDIELLKSVSRLG